MWAGVALTLPCTVAQQVSPDSSPGRPLSVDLEEKVEVQILQIELNAWPKSGRAADCLDLDANDFELTIRGEPRAIVGLDALGDFGQPILPGDKKAVDGYWPMQYVVLFDMAHLDSAMQTCGRTLPKAISYARELLSTQFKPGDRVILATFRGWPEIQTPWMRSQEEALGALDELEVNEVITGVPGMHRHDVEWLDGWLTFMEALSFEEGRKQVIYLGDDFCPS
jgi:hypothetical protein